MLRDELLRLLRAQPFVPFRIVMNNGDKYEVPHPEFVHVGPTSIYYYFPGMPPPEVSDWRILSVLLVAHLEPVSTGKPKSMAKSA